MAVSAAALGAFLTFATLQPPFQSGRFESISTVGFYLTWPAMIAAFLLVGGVHGGHLDAVPVVAAVVNGAICFVGIFAALRWIVKRRTSGRVSE